MSFPKNVGQIPLYYAHKNTGRPLAQGKWFEKFRSNYLMWTMNRFTRSDTDCLILPSLTVIST